MSVNEGIAVAVIMCGVVLIAGGFMGLVGGAACHFWRDWQAKKALRERMERLR